MNKNWNGLIKILDIWKTDCNNNVIWKNSNLYNVFHLLGEEFILKAAFVGGKTDSTVIPTNYYFGLDNRVVLDAADTMDTIVTSGNEPNNNGYNRIATPSLNVFSTSLVVDHYRVTGPILTFSATGGSWGPVNNLFLTTTQNNTGILIASASLSEGITMAIGESINMRLGLSLKDC